MAMTHMFVHEPSYEDTLEDGFNSTSHISGRGQNERSAKQ
jgi:translation initiation factor IF-1